MLTVALLRRLAATFDAEVRLTAGHDLGSVWFETHAAWLEPASASKVSSGVLEEGAGRGRRRLHGHVAHVWHGEFPPVITQTIEISHGTGTK
jgi:hypothetical protein